MKMPFELSSKRYKIELIINNHSFKIFEMKKLLLVFTCVAAISACNKYDDTWIKDEFSSINDRLNELEQKCNKLNSDIASIQNILNAIQQNEFVTDVKAIKENGQVIGYEIHFSESETITLYHGEDGEDGTMPQISVKKDTDGIYYWTVDGEWLKDSSNNKIPTTGEDGAPGADGKDGQPGTDGVNGKPGLDAVSPKLRIENGYWEISYDAGSSWTQLYKAVGENGNDGENGVSYFKGVTHDNDYVYITINDGTVLTMPKAKEFDLTLELSSNIPCTPGSTLNIPYILTGNSSDVEIITICEGAWSAKVNKVDATTGHIVIQVPAEIDDSKILVAASNAKRTIIKTLTFAEAVIATANSFLLSDNSGELTINLNTNYEYTVSTNASWITSIKTKAVRDESIVVSYQALPSGTVTRTAEISLTNEYSGVIKTISLIQGNPVSLSKKSLEMNVGNEYSISATSKFGHTEFMWFSSDSDAVRVDNNGKLTALATGYVIITAMTADFAYSATCTVTVKQ